MFLSIKDNHSVNLCHVDETKYLHAKLSNVDMQFTSFHPSGFRTLKPLRSPMMRDNVDAWSPLDPYLNEDETLRMDFERLKEVQRALAELEVAKEIIHHRLMDRMQEGISST